MVSQIYLVVFGRMVLVGVRSSGFSGSGICRELELGGCWEVRKSRGFVFSGWADTPGVWN